MCDKRKIKWPKKAIAINIPIYDQTVWLFTDKSTYMKAMASLGIETKLPNSGVARWSEHTTTGEVRFVIGVFDNKFSTLVHEAGHMERFVCDYLGIKKNDDEAHCYLLSYLFEQGRQYINEGILK